MSTIQVRRGTAAQWSSANPVLSAGEPGFETDTNVLKIGDGITAWSSLPVYTGTASAILTQLLTVDGSGSLLDADTVDGFHASSFATATDLTNHISDSSDAHDASAISYNGSTNISATDVEAALDELDSEKVAKAGDSMSGTLELLQWTELSGESPDGWPLVPFDPSSTHKTSLIIPNSTGSNDLHVWGHRGHLVLGLQDTTNLLGYGANYIFPFMTMGHANVSGITFAKGWRFNDDPSHQGGVIAPYESGIANGNGTGMHLTADYTASAYANNVKVFQFSPTGLLVPAASSTIVPLTVKGATSQSVNLQEWQDSSANILAFVDELGEFYATAYQAGEGSTSTMVVNGISLDSQFSAHNTGRAIFEAHSYSAVASDSSGFYAARARGTASSPTAVNDNDELAFYAAVGYDGTDYALGGYTLFKVAGTPGSNDMPTEFIVALSGDGSDSPVERFFISPTGDVTLVGGAVYMDNDKGILMKNATGTYKTVFNFDSGNNVKVDSGTVNGNDIVFLARNVEMARFDQSANNLLFADSVDLQFDTTNGSQIGTSASEKIGFHGATPSVQDSGWSVSNEVSTKTFDADSVSVDTLADVLGTLIETLKSKGILGG